MAKGNLSLYASLMVVCSTMLEPGAALRVERVVGNLTKPVYVCQAPGDSDRLFILEQHTGRIRIFRLSTGALNNLPFLTVTGITGGSEQGLLGLAFDPGYQTNRWFYVNYTTSGGGAAGQTQIARYQATDADTANAASRTILLSYNQPESNHNGGWIGFGLDGYLYISSGDGGGGNDLHGPIGNSQNRSNLLGKILRIDVNATGAPYAIPDGNPYKGHATFRPEIWAFGLRNPWRCSIDRETGDLWIGDVGQNAREEIDFNPAGLGGLNFGWRPREGKIQNPAFPSEVPVTPATEPVHDYTRSFGISVTGGYRYRGKMVPELQGLYLFGDYGTARFWTLTGITNPVVTEVTSQLNPSTPTPRPIQNISSFGEDNEGELYICDYAGGTSGAGEIYKILSTLPPVRLTEPHLQDGKLIFSFNANSGTRYAVETRESFGSETTWNVAQEIGPLINSAVMRVTNDVSQAQQFFRLRTNP